MMRGVSFSCSCFVFSSILESTSVTISGEDSLILIKRWRTFSRIGKCRNVFPQCLLPVLLIRHEGPEVSHLCQCPCFDKSSPASVSQLGFPPLFWLCLPQSPFPCWNRDLQVLFLTVSGLVFLLCSTHTIRYLFSHHSYCHLLSKSSHLPDCLQCTCFSQL